MAHPRFLSFVDVVIGLSTACVNVACWIATIRWAGYIDHYLYEQNHTEWPGPPRWLPISYGAFSILNLYLAGTCFLAGATAGFWLYRRRRYALGIALAACTALSAAALTVLSIIATF